MIQLTLNNLSVMRGDKPILQNISCAAQGGEFIGLIGPNGAGKTSLMRAMLGLLPHSGECSLSSLSRDAKAKTVSWLPQSRDIAWPMSLEALVRLGRHPHNTTATQDDEAVQNALQAMELNDFATRKATALSGGETARVLIARCLAQSTPLLLADEPLADLDMAHQLSVLELFAAKAAQGDLVISSIHDIGLALRYCTRFILLGDQQLLADGKPEDIVKEPIFSHVFGIETLFVRSDDGPIFMPKKRLASQK